MPYTLRFPSQAERHMNITWEQLMDELKEWCKDPVQRQVFVIQALTNHHDHVKLEVRLMWLPRTRPHGFHMYSSWDAWHIQRRTNPRAEPMHNPPHGGWEASLDTVLWAVAGVLRRYREDICLGKQDNARHFPPNGQVPKVEEQRYDLIWFSRVQEEQFLRQVQNEPRVGPSPSDCGPGGQAAGSPNQDGGLGGGGGVGPGTHAGHEERTH